MSKELAHQPGDALISFTVPEIIPHQFSKWGFLLQNKQVAGRLRFYWHIMKKALAASELILSKEMRTPIRIVEVVGIESGMLHFKSCISMRDFFYFCRISASLLHKNCRFVNDVNVLTTILTTIQRKTSIFSMTSRFVSIVECA